MHQYWGGSPVQDDHSRTQFLRIFHFPTSRALSSSAQLQSRFQGKGKRTVEKNIRPQSKSDKHHNNSQSISEHLATWPHLSLKGAGQSWLADSQLITMEEGGNGFWRTGSSTHHRPHFCVHPLRPPYCLLERGGSLLQVPCHSKSRISLCEMQTSQDQIWFLKSSNL